MINSNKRVMVLWFSVKMMWVDFSSLTHTSFLQPYLKKFDVDLESRRWYSLFRPGAEDSIAVGKCADSSVIGMLGL